MANETWQDGVTKDMLMGDARKIAKAPHDSLETSAHIHNLLSNESNRFKSDGVLLPLRERAQGLIDNALNNTDVSELSSRIAIVVANNINQILNEGSLDEGSILKAEEIIDKRDELLDIQIQEANAKLKGAPFNGTEALRYVVRAAKNIANLQLVHDLLEIEFFSENDSERLMEELSKEVGDNLQTSNDTGVMTDILSLLQLAMEDFSKWETNSLMAVDRLEIKEKFDSILGGEAIQENHIDIPLPHVDPKGWERQMELLSSMRTTSLRFKQAQSLQPHQLEIIPYGKRLSDEKLERLARRNNHNWIDAFQGPQRKRAESTILSSKI